MSTPSDQPCKCADCEWTGTRAELGTDIEDCVDLEQRLDAGSVVPAGECPKCEAFAYLERPDLLEAAQKAHAIMTATDLDEYFDMHRIDEALKALKDAITAAGAVPREVP